MSVLKQKRQKSKMEFVNKAYEIYAETVSFLSRLSARYARLVAEDTAKLAGEVMDHSEKANSIYPNTQVAKDLRMNHLLEARGSLMALDVRLTHIYTILMTNPEGAFTTSKGSTVCGGDAERKLDHMAESLGLKIDEENNLLKGQLEMLKKQ